MSILYSDDRRFTYSCEVKISSKDDISFYIPISEIVNYLKANFKQIVYKRDNGNSIYRILQAKLIQDRYLVLFLQYINRNASDPAFADTITGKSRIVKKNTNEGGACAAHLVIDTNTLNTLFPNCFTASLEEMQGLSRGAVEDLLNYAIRNIAYQDPNDKNKTHKPQINITFLAANNFEEQLVTGKIKSVTAFKYEAFQSGALDPDEDEETRIQYKETHRLEFGKVNTGIINETFNKLAKLAKFSKSKGYDRLKVTHEVDHKTQSSDYNLDKVEQLTNEQTAQDIRVSPFAMKQRILLDKPIYLCDHKWHSELIRKMIEFI
ncbi:hypothetical protein E4T80_09745 [Muribacter muris]|uniref:Uncharacterized protein n=1 Tax=Muribacter muris TaxID=67855 RepID=A0A4Y9JRW8_9PAST|nr:hypothetical protein [Muribacter muris]MBF0785740.1 hypothetical protein [Muribacter muris]MBF0828288.1 hypothetical protein [Muribacter muris]TFV08563.1 hypothetical protein E4T80_09745 [Muribacter muris]